MNRSVRQTWWKSERTPGRFFPSYDDEAFWPTKVPSAYNLVYPELLYYEGLVVYCHRFEARKPGEGELAFLHFGAVNDSCRVFLNGTWVGGHEGGFTPFTLDVTGNLQEHNRLLVFVESCRNGQSVPGEIHDWFHYGGILGPVRLYYKPEEYIREIRVTTALDGEDAVLRIRAMTEGPVRGRKTALDIALNDIADGSELMRIRLHCTPGSWEEQTARLPLHLVKLWSPQTPHLYRISAGTARDAWQDETGIREIRTEGRSILLNGRPVVLQGAAAWTEDPDRGIFFMGQEAAERTVRLLQDLHANFARAGHCPNSPEFVRACSRLGILLWMEVPAYWIRDMHQPARSNLAMRMMAGMLRHYANSPSVMFWSIGNESIFHFPNQGESNIRYFLEAADYIREHDPSRLVTYTGGFEGDDLGNVEELYPSSVMKKLDVIGINSYCGIHDGADPGKPEEFGNHRKKLKYAAGFGKPVILAEAGIDAVRGEQGFDFGEERQRIYHGKLQQLFHEGLEEGWLQGMCLFVLNDYRTPIKLGRFQQGYNRKGLVDESFQPKAAYAVVREGYARSRSMDAPQQNK
jgi:beta-glucuronidase